MDNPTKPVSLLCASMMHLFTILRVFTWTVQLSSQTRSFQLRVTATTIDSAREILKASLKKFQTILPLIQEKEQTLDSLYETNREHISNQNDILDKLRKLETLSGQITTFEKEFETAKKQKDLIPVYREYEELHDIRCETCDESTRMQATQRMEELQKMEGFNAFALLENVLSPTFERYYASCEQRLTTAKNELNHLDELKEQLDSLDAEIGENETMIQTIKNDINELYKKVPFQDLLGPYTVGIDKVVLHTIVSKYDSVQKDFSEDETCTLEEFINAVKPVIEEFHPVTVFAALDD
jgi:DNA repair exonuclease SbcCD ATPase subunit